MPDYLMRDQVPLTGREWQALDSAVVQVARRSLVARRFLTLAGPVGAGVQSIPNDTYAGLEEAQISLFGAEEKAPIHIQRRRFVPVPLLYQDFALNWRDLEAARQSGGLLDTTGAAIAASLVSAMEDRVILNGYDEFQQEGFLNAEGRQQLPLGDWGVAGGAFTAVVGATEALVAAGFRRPYTVVVSPQLMAQLNRVFDNTGVLELDQVRRLVEGGVYATQTLPPKAAVVVAPGTENVDLVIGQDMAVAFLETTSMEHHFRVLETLSLRIKRPGSIVALS
jgi:uncharacterized linocin/CFP29 family protein